MAKFSAYLSDDAGATASEYALILVLIGIGLFLAARTLQAQISGAMHRAATTIGTAS